MKYPTYCLVYERPVKVVRKWFFGFDIQALNLETGDFESNYDYMTDVFHGGSEVDYISEEEFNSAVERARKNISK